MKGYSAQKLGIVLGAGWLVAGWVACSGGGTTQTTSTGGHGGSGHTTSGTGGDPVILTDGGCTPASCASLNATCGKVTDPTCGGVVDCGDCPSGQTCGGGGVHYQCGTGTPDACAPLDCATQHITCGQAGDGCGNTLSCGTCAAPKTCGGDPAHLGQCGCTGLCAQIPDCTGGATTTLSGKVYDPAHLHPLYNALVYIPNNPSDPGLQPFPAGISCDVCGATAAGDPLVTAYTAPDGSFTLTNVPAGGSVPLVIQMGRWRRQFTVSVPTSCGANSVPDAQLTMPKTQAEGDIPRIGILAGGFDPMECVLRKMGIADSEFTNPSGGGRIQFYEADDADLPWYYQGYGLGHGARIDANTPGQAALMQQAVIDQYDMVILECKGYDFGEDAAAQQVVRTYAETGGRVFASDFSYGWLTNNGNWSSVANWHTAQQPQGAPQTGVLDLASNPKGAAFQQWLTTIGVLSAGSTSVGINPVYQNSDGVVAPTQQWLYWGGSHPIHFTFNTPVGAPSTGQCGRVVFSDWHADGANLSQDKIFPSECPAGPMTPQEAILEFMLFDLSACVQPYVPLCTPTTCGAQGVECGHAGDGCGNLLDCGACPTGQFCGGGGPGKCGTSTSCTPLTCPDQKLQCGQAGDGCGNVINCGNCPTGQVCGLGGPGICGSVQ